MTRSLLDILSSHYGLHDAVVLPAPRQKVAETHRIQAGGERYFSKVVKNRLFIPKIQRSLPILEAMRVQGFARAAYPLKTQSGALWVMVDAALIVVFNEIDAPQTEAYDQYTFGALLASLHTLTPPANSPEPTYAFPDGFKDAFERLLTFQGDDPALARLARLLRQREGEIRRHYRALERLIPLCCAGGQRVLTHGDAGGNILARSPTDIYLIDWDEILLASPERDLWFYDGDPAFLAGYRSIIPNHQTNSLERQYWVCKQHFDYMSYYLNELQSHAPEAHRLAVIEDFEAYFDGWIKPHLEAIR